MDQDFEFHIKIDNERVYRGKDGGLYIEGVASSTAIDSHETIFNENCQEGFAFDINAGADTDEPVLIEVEHKGNEAPIMVIGVITKAFVDAESRLNIVARLDDKNPVALYYFEILSNPDPKLGRPKQLGLSINGYVKEAHWEYNEELQKQIRVFDRCVLQKVGIVRSPSNPETWVEKMARSYNWNITKENKELAMENEQVVSQEQTTVVEEVREEVKETVSTEAEVVETVADAVVEVAEAPAEEKTEEVVTEVVEVEVTEVPSDEVTPVVDEPIFTEVDRTEWSDSMQILEVLEDMVSAMARLENFIVWEQYEAVEGEDESFEIKAGKEALAAIASAIPTIQAIFAEECKPMMKSTDPVTEVKAEDTTVREEVVSESVVDVASEVKSAMGEVTESLLNAVREMVSPLSEKIEALSSKIDSEETRNKELTDRLERIEKKPTTAPGSQLVGDEILRGEESAYDLAVKRAKEKGDTETLTKLFLQRLHTKK